VAQTTDKAAPLPLQGKFSAQKINSLKNHAHFLDEKKVRAPSGRVEPCPMGGSWSCGVPCCVVGLSGEKKKKKKKKKEEEGQQHEK